MLTPGQVPPHGPRLLGMRLSEAPGTPADTGPARTLEPPEIGGLASLLRDLADLLETVRVFPTGNAKAARDLIAEARATADMLMGHVPAEGRM